jgi:hypothetical protein
MKTALQALALILTATLIAATAASVAFLAIGALIARWLPLSLFQATALVTVSALVMVMTANLIATAMHNHSLNPWHHNFDEWEPEDDEDEDDLEDDHNETHATTVKRDAPKIGRNAPCPCGSGRKFKLCCGRLEHRE